MYQVPETDRKEILKYLSTKPYIEVAPLIETHLVPVYNLHGHTHCGY